MINKQPTIDAIEKRMEMNIFGGPDVPNDHATRQTYAQRVFGIIKALVARGHIHFFSKPTSGWGYYNKGQRIGEKEVWVHGERRTCRCGKKQFIPENKSLFLVDLE